MYVRKIPQNRMVSKSRSCLSLIPALCIFIFPALSWAVPREVTLFPQTARVTGAAKVKLVPEGKELRKAVITIPGQADPAFLTIRLPLETRLRIEDQVLRSSAREEDVKTRDLRKRIKTFKEEKNALHASAQALDSQIQFWQQQTKAKVSKQAEAGAVALAIGKNIKKAFQDKLNLQPEIVRLDQKIKELEEELKRATATHETIWEVTVFFAGNPTNEVLLDYSYTLTDCGWSPFYRLDAQSRPGEIRFSQEAEVWQNSGENWNDVNLILANITAPTASLTPPDVTPWIIRPPQEIKTKGQGAAAKVKASQAPATVKSKADESVSPPTGPFTLLKAGRKTIPSGSPQRIKIKEELWPADFSYLARPSHSSQAFIGVSFHLQEAREIPPGNAIFFHNGALAGKGNFSLSGREGRFFIGHDPFVTATLSGPEKEEINYQEKVIKHRKHWQIKAENSHPFPVRLRIEVPRPRFWDNKIKMTLHHEPQVSEEKSALLVWELELLAGQNQSILLGVELEAPRDYEIDPGWK